jgi:hypothetical protein
MKRLIRMFEERPVRVTLSMFAGVWLTAAAFSGIYSGLTSGLMVVAALAIITDIFLIT